MDVVIALVLILLVLVIGYWLGKDEISPISSSSSGTMLVGQAGANGSIAASNSGSSSGSSSASGKYAHLVALLRKTPKWLYFDESSRQRMSITFTLAPSGNQLTMAADVATKPGSFTYGPAQGRDDTIEILDPAKGGPDKYATYLMYVNDHSLVVEEKTAGKITFQQQLSG